MSRHIKVITNKVYTKMRYRNNGTTIQMFENSQTTKIYSPRWNEKKHIL